MTQQYAIRRKSDGFIMRTHKVYNGGPWDSGSWTIGEAGDWEVFQSSCLKSIRRIMRNLNKHDAGKYYLAPIFDCDAGDYEIVKVVMTYEVIE